MAARARVSPTGWRRACTIYKPARPITTAVSISSPEESDESQFNRRNCHPDIRCGRSCGQSAARHRGERGYRHARRPLLRDHPGGAPGISSDRNGLQHARPQRLSAGDLGGHHRRRHKGATKSGETIEIAGLKLTERATIDLGLLDLLHRPYREQTINRDTTYTFNAGSPVFMLEASDGSRYVMQAYAQIVDKTLDYAALPALGGKLKLPSGWRYSSMVPEKDLVLGAAGKATVIQDELENTYQKLD